MRNEINKHEETIRDKDCIIGRVTSPNEDLQKEIDKLKTWALMEGKTLSLKKELNWELRQDISKFKKRDHGRKERTYQR